jgi:hypothetical protein
MIMKTVYAEITLKYEDVIAVSDDGLVRERETRQVNVTATADTSVLTLVIDERTREQLGLTIKGLRRSTLADGSKADCKTTELVQVNWKDRQSCCEALVLPNSDEMLLGAIPLQDMNVMIYPALGVLIGAHGDVHARMIK